MPQLPPKSLSNPSTPIETPEQKTLARQAVYVDNAPMPVEIADSRE
jgi:hypothetical protein